MPRENKDPEMMPQINAAQEAPALAAPAEAAEDAQEMQEEVSVPGLIAERKDPRSGASAGSSFAKNLWRGIVFLFKLGLFLAVLAALAAGVYFGWPIVYNRYILPVQNNTAQMALLETRLQASQDQLSALQTRGPGLAAAQEGQALALTALAPRMETFTSAINNHTLALATLENAQSSLLAGDQARRTELEQQVNLLKSMELLSRARLFLYQSNFGLAKQDVQAARDLLAGLLDAPAFATEKNLGEVVQRLDLTLSRLPGFPVVASDDLDIAWQILLQGQPYPTATATALPVGGESSPSPTAIFLVGTATPMPYPTPTFVPTSTP